MTQANPTIDPATSEEQLRLKLQGLQHSVVRSRRLVKLLIGLAIGLILLLLTLLIGLHLYNVLQYATLSNIEANEVEGRSDTITIYYTPTSAGKIDFVRDSTDLVQTVTEHANPAETSTTERKFAWQGDPDQAVQFRATYREGLSLTTKDLNIGPPR